MAFPAVIAVSRVQGNTHGNGSSSSTTVAVTLAAPVGIGNLICVSVGWGDAGISTMAMLVSDDKSNVYTTVDKSRISATSFSFSTAFFANATNGPQTITATISGSVQFATILVDEFSGIRATSPFDGHAIALPTPSASINAQSSGNITTTVGGDLIYGSCLNIDGAGPIIYGTRFATDLVISNNYMTEHLVQTAAGSMAATFTAANGSDRYVVACMAFKPTQTTDIVALQAIDGELLIGPSDNVSMTNNYFARNGFTSAAAMGMDSPSFYPFGPWAARLGANIGGNDVTRWLDLGLNIAMVPDPGNTTLTAVTTGNFPLIVGAAQGNFYDYTNYPFALPSQAVGLLTYDEPNTLAQALTTPLGTTPNAVQDARFWWVNNTWSWFRFPPYGTSPTVVLSTLQATPNATTRHIDIQSCDIYWCGGFADQTGFSGSYLYPPGDNLAGNLTQANTRIGAHYGDMVDWQRAQQARNFPAPIWSYVENGGPFTTNTTIDTYIQPPELDWALWSVVIHGGRGTVFFNHTFGGPHQSSDNFAEPAYQTNWPGQTISIYAQAKASIAAIKAMASVINSPFVINYCHVSPKGYEFPVEPFSGSNTSGDLNGGIDMCVHWYNNAFYIFATTREPQTTTNLSATFTVKSGTLATVINESRTIPIVAGLFTDTFATASTVHIYQIATGQASPPSGGASLAHHPHTFTRARWRELKMLMAAEKAARIKAAKFTKPEKQEPLLAAADAAATAILVAEIEGTNARIDRALERNAITLRTAIRASTQASLVKEAAAAMSQSRAIARLAADEQDEMIALLLMS